ncbi:MAG: DUF4197 domain-containing protein [Bacteroidota bacterium]
MKRILIILALIPMLTACDPAAVQKVLDTAAELTDAPLTQEQIGQGLKQALEIGISEGAKKLSQEDGYYKSAYKILLPEEARKVTDKLQNIPGFSQVEEVILEKINRGAEDAAKKATPIFVDAIKQMSFKDATNILMGGQKDAATQYLNQATYDKLYAEFTPVIIASLDKFNARKYWGDAVDKYNKIPLVQDVNPSLEDYVTTQALLGLFDMVEKKELDIRENVAARTTDLLKKVFAKQDS